MPLEKENPRDDSVSMKQYVDNQFMWQKRVDKLNGFLSGTEAKLRELSITGETRLLQSQILMMKENMELARINLEAWKMVNNEWKDQSKEKEKMFATKTETEKDVHALQQNINASNKMTSDGFISMATELKSIAKSQDENRGRDRIIMILISIAVAFIVAYVKKP